MEAVLAWRGSSCTSPWPYCKASPVLDDGPHIEGTPEWELLVGSTESRGGGGSGCKTMLEWVVGRLFHCVATVFFASLQRCSCLNVETKDDSSVFDDSDRYLVDFSSDDHDLDLCSDNVVDHELEISK